LWALQKEAIKKGSYVAETGNKYSFIRDVILGVVGFVVFVVLSLFSYKTYKKCKRRRLAAAYCQRTSRRRERDDDYYADEDGGSVYTPDYTRTFSKGTGSVASSQHSYQYSLEDGIVSPKSNETRTRSRSPSRPRLEEPSRAESSEYSSQYDDPETETSLVEQIDQMAKTVSSFMDKPPKQVRRDVYAPAGKLGIIVDTSSDGPVVHSIKADSPLVGKVFTGDYIVAVDDEDTSNWSAHYVTKLVARKSGSVRKLTLLSNNWD